MAQATESDTTTRRSFLSGARALIAVAAIPPAMAALPQPHADQAVIDLGQRLAASWQYIVANLDTMDDHETMRRFIETDSMMRELAKTPAKTLDGFVVKGRMIKIAQAVGGGDPAMFGSATRGLPESLIRDLIALG
jgi:hypothetical protein